MSEQATNRRTVTGVVVSDKMDKSIRVQVVKKYPHPLYGKYIKGTKNFMANDPENECKMGDTVEIRECRPLSKNKTWELIKIIEKAE